MKKKVILCIVGMFILLGVMILVIFNYKVYRKLELINVNVSNYDEENKVLKINLQRKVSLLIVIFIVMLMELKILIMLKGKIINVN